MSDLPEDYSGLIVGPYASAKPKYLNSLKKLIEDYRLQNRVYFVNAKDDIREIYYLSEVVLNLSSKPEPFGRTILEAAMMGKKIAGWDRGGPGEVLEMCFPQGKVEFNKFNSLVETVKNLSEKEDVPSNIFLTSDLFRSCVYEIQYYMHLATHINFCFYILNELLYQHLNIRIFRCW